MDAASASGAVAGRRRVPRLAIFAFLCIVAALAAGIGGVAVERWRTGLHEFGGAGNVQGGPIALGKTGYAGEYAWPTTGPRRVHLTDASAVVRLNTADASVKVMVCTIAPSQHIATIGLLDHARPYCARLRPFIPGTLLLGSARADIVLAITPHRAGKVHVAGVELSYSDGVR